MSKLMNQQVLLKSRPIGEPTENNFNFAEVAIPEPEPGEVLNRTIYLSLDPYIAFSNPVRYNKGLKPLVRQAKLYLIYLGIAICEVE